MSKLQIYSDLLNEKHFLDFKTAMLGNWFPWYFLQQSVPDQTINQVNKSAKFFKSSIFRHRFYDNFKCTSNQSVIVDYIVSEISKRTKSRYVVKSAYANLLPANNFKRGLLDVPHVDRSDQDDDSFTGIFYFTNNNCNTILYDEIETNYLTDGNGVAKVKEMPILRKISSEENKLVLFDSRTYHSAPAACSTTRLVINININREKQSMFVFG